MSRKKKKGKHRHPPPRYRKQVEAGTRGMSGPADGAAVAAPPLARPAAARVEPERREPSTVVSLEPLAPIIVRSGRPMNERADADPAQFPRPSTVAGCLRTAWARATERPFGPELAQLAVAGPLLLGSGGRILAPKPADALYFGHEESARCMVRAEPGRFDRGVGADLPEGLLPVTLTAQQVGKPGDGPAWWSWDDLLAFRSGESVSLDQLSGNGWSPPRGDLRTHVAIDADTGTAAPGLFFQTQGLDLDVPPAAFRTGAPRSAKEEGPASEDPDGPSSGGLRLLLRCAKVMDASLVHLGGERRLAALEPEPEGLWPTPPEGWLERVSQARALCLTLLTPGVFSSGYRPGWLDGTLTGSPPTASTLRLRLRAVAVERWQPWSGWDLARHEPKPTRKLVPAGATYWFDVLGACDADALAALWLASVCDDEQDRRDGFGLALPGPWTPPPADDDENRRS